MFQHVDLSIQRFIESSRFSITAKLHTEKSKLVFFWLYFFLCHLLVVFGFMSFVIVPRMMFHYQAYYFVGQFVALSLFIVTAFCLTHLVFSYVVFTVILFQFMQTSLVSFGYMCLAPILLFVLQSNYDVGMVDWSTLLFFGVVCSVTCLFLLSFYVVMFVYLCTKLVSFVVSTIRSIR